MNDIIKFEFYGRLRRIAGMEYFSLPIKLPKSLGDAIAELVEVFPELNQSLEVCACAVGDEIVLRNYILDSGTDEGLTVALLPPVAGG